MTREDDYCYCPFAYCYSNYAREGYAPNKLAYTDVVELNGMKLKTTLGGTGLAVSTSTKYPELALEFARYAAAPETQAGIYTYAGGQPGHAKAWENEALGQLTGGFFRTLRPLMERSYLRPRYHGYLHFQDLAGTPVQEVMMGKLSAKEALRQMNQFYKQSIQIKNNKNGH
jgi:multiple sugar transport system substrate-binding protein